MSFDPFGLLEEDFLVKIGNNSSRGDSGASEIDAFEGRDGEIGQVNGTGSFSPFSSGRTG